MEVLPFRPLALTFQNMCYWVPRPGSARGRGKSKEGGELQLLKEVTGAFRPGVLTALVGVSGAG